MKKTIIWVGKVESSEVIDIPNKKVSACRLFNSIRGGFKNNPKIWRNGTYTYNFANIEWLIVHRDGNTVVCHPLVNNNGEYKGAWMCYNFTDLNKPYCDGCDCIFSEEIAEMGWFNEINMNLC
jgi:CDGSH-type Zn-finger protein